MVYEFKYDGDADALFVLLREHGKLSHAEELGDILLHVDKKGNPLFLEVLNASKIIPKMVRAMAVSKVVAQTKL